MCVCSRVCIILCVLSMCDCVNVTVTVSVTVCLCVWLDSLLSNTSASKRSTWFSAAVFFNVQLQTGRMLAQLEKSYPVGIARIFEGPAHCRPIPIGNAAARPDTFTRLCDCVTIAGWWFPSQRKRVQPVSHVPFVLLTFCTGTDEARKCARDTCSRRGHTNNWSNCK